MNKRQAKKAYKKKHGHNPPKFTQEELKVMLQTATQKEIQGNCEYFRKYVTGAIETLKDWASKVVKAAKDLEERVKTMPEDEFNKILADNDFTIEQISLLKTIRAKAEKENKDNDSNN